jgi:hypothetical protein
LTELDLASDHPNISQTIATEYYGDSNLCCFKRNHKKEWGERDCLSPIIESVVYTIFNLREGQSQ